MSVKLSNIYIENINNFELLFLDKTGESGICMDQMKDH